MNDEQKIWREALGRLREIDGLDEADGVRSVKLTECREWMMDQTGVPRLCGLARLLESGMSRRRLWSVMVPVERSVSRLSVTDVDILDSDLPKGVRQGGGMPFTVVVDSLRSAFNVGGIFRSAECFGVEEVILCGYTPLPDQPQVARAALGAEGAVKWRYAEDLRTEIGRLEREGVTCYALETVEGAPFLEETEWSFPCALILGNERFGLDPDVVRLCGGGAVRIRLHGRKNSLNVVSAFSVAAYAVRRRFEMLVGCVGFC